MTSITNNLPNELPSPLECPACGYDLSGASSFTCSECGWVSVPEDAEATGARRHFLNQSIPARYGWSAFVLLPTLVTGSIIATRMWSVSMTARQWVGGSLVILVLGTVILGPTMSGLVPLHRRRLIVQLWVATAGWLHLPFHAGWIVGLLFFPVSVVFASKHPAFLVIQAIAALLFLLGWAWMAGYSYLAWHRRWHALMDDSWWRTAEPAHTVFMRGSGIVFGVNACAGLVLYWLVVAVLTS